MVGMGGLGNVLPEFMRTGTSIDNMLFVFTMGEAFECSARLPKM